MAEVYPIEFPVEYLEAIDEVLVGAAFAGRYNDGAAEFVAGRQISIPDIDFGASPDPTDYNRFASEDGVNINRTVYTLDKDVEKQFYVDALTVQDEPVSAMTGVIAQYQRTILAPYIDKHFFEKCVGKARTRATETLSELETPGTLDELVASAWGDAVPDLPENPEEGAEGNAPDGSEDGSKPTKRAGQGTDGAEQAGP